MKGDVVLNLPAEKAWKMYRDDGIISQINPGIYVKESIEKIEEVESGWSVTYHVIAGNQRNMYDPYRVAFTFAPVEGEEKTKCIAQWRVKFELLNPATAPPEKARDAALDSSNRSRSSS